MRGMMGGLLPRSEGMYRVRTELWSEVVRRIVDEENCNIFHVCLLTPLHLAFDSRSEPDETSSAQSIQHLRYPVRGNLRTSRSYFIFAYMLGTAQACCLLLP